MCEGARTVAHTSRRVCFNHNLIFLMLALDTRDLHNYFEWGTMKVPFILLLSLSLFLSLTHSLPFVLKRYVESPGSYFELESEFNIGVTVVIWQEISNGDLWRLNQGWLIWSLLALLPSPNLWNPLWYLFLVAQTNLPRSPGRHWFIQLNSVVTITNTTS